MSKEDEEKGGANQAGGWEGDETPGVGEEEKGDRTAFENSTTGLRARMNLKGEGRGQEDGEKGREGD